MECGNAPLAVIEGCVEHGRRLGRELGFPTANLSVPDDLALDDGVYRSRVEVAGRSYDAMSNLGRNPSVGGTERRLETHISDSRANSTDAACGSSCCSGSAANGNSPRSRSSAPGSNRTAKRY